MISDREINEGWTIVRHRFTRVLYKAKVWQNDGISKISGIAHKQGDVMRCYDDISLKRLATYDIKNNHRYRAAVRGLHLVHKRRNNYIKHHGHTDGLHHAVSQKHMIGNLGRQGTSDLVKAGRLETLYSPRTGIRESRIEQREQRRSSDIERNNRRKQIVQSTSQSTSRQTHINMWDRKSEIVQQRLKIE